MTLSESLAALNATLNATAGVLMVSAFVAIRRKNVPLHRRLMIAAFVTSCLFLVSYLTRYGLSGDTPFQGQGAWRVIYFAILIPHVILAMVVVPLIVRTLFLGVKSRFPQHRRVARLTFPIWLYVSVTGVIVYLMLYHFPA